MTTEIKTMEERKKALIELGKNKMVRLHMNKLPKN